MKQVYKILYAFLSAICLLLAGNFFVILTGGTWYYFKFPDTVLKILLFFAWFVFGWLSYQFGKYIERNRPRTRVTNLMESYQTEPHGIRYTQKARNE